MRSTGILFSILLATSLLMLVVAGVKFSPLWKKPIPYQPVEVPKDPSIPKVEEYHVVVLAYGTTATASHVFATWTRSLDKEVVEQVDISWCPVRRSARLIISEVPGKNKSLKETLKDAHKANRFSYWLMKTDRSFYEAALRQRETLKRYRFIDNSSRPKGVNCIHAVSDVAGYLETGSVVGIDAGKLAADHFVNLGKAYPSNDYWVLAKLSIHKSR